MSVLNECKCKSLPDFVERCRVLCLGQGGEQECPKGFQQVQALSQQFGRLVSQTVKQAVPPCLLCITGGHQQELSGVERVSCSVVCCAVVWFVVLQCGVLKLLTKAKGPGAIGDKQWEGLFMQVWTYERVGSMPVAPHTRFGGMAGGMSHEVLLPPDLYASPVGEHRMGTPLKG